MVHRVHKYADGGKVVDPWTSNPERRASYRNRNVLEKSSDGSYKTVRKKVPPRSPADEALGRAVVKAGLNRPK